jgi:hypothetical protein
MVSEFAEIVTRNAFVIAAAAFFCEMFNKILRFLACERLTVSFDLPLDGGWPQRHKADP